MKIALIILLQFTFLTNLSAQIKLNDDLMVTYQVTFKPYLHKPFIEWNRTFKLLNPEYS